MTRGEAAAFMVAAEIARLAALRDPTALAAALDAGDPAEMAMIVQRHRLSTTVRATLGTDHPLLAPPRRGWPSAQDLGASYAEVAGALDAAGIPVLLLKGAVLAERLYGDVSRRHQSDIDLLVHHRDRRRARRVVAGLGFRRSRRDGHSVSYWRDKTGVDLHHAIRTSPAYAIDHDAMWDRAITATAGGTTVRTLADRDTLTVLAVSLLEDVAFGMAKVKNALDIWLLLRVLDGTTDWDRWFAELADQHLESIAVNACDIAVFTFGAGDVPRVAAALDLRSTRSRVAGREHAAALMSYPRGSAIPMRWFAGVYPGSVLRFRWHALVTGLPDTLKDVRMVKALTSRRG